MTIGRPRVRQAGQSAPGIAYLDAAVAAEGPGLPLPRLPRRERDRSVHYALTTVGHNGRLADRSLISALNWLPGQHVSIEASTESLIARALPTGGTAITQNGFLLLSAAIRHRCNLQYRDKVLLAAYLNEKILVIWMLSALDQMASSRLNNEPARTGDVYPN